MTETSITPEEQKRRDIIVLEDFLLREISISRRYYPSAMISALTGIPVADIIPRMLRLKETSRQLDISTRKCGLSPIWEVRKKEPTQ